MGDPNGMGHPFIIAKRNVMLKTCKYCGRVHQDTYDCGKKPKQMKKEDRATLFRWGSAWKKKRAEIVELDGFRCQACKHNLFGTIREYETDSLEVHHIVPLIENYELRLDNDNLITLCSYHHHEADAGNIEADTLREYIADRVEGGI